MRANTLTATIVVVGLIGSSALTPARAQAPAQGPVQLPVQEAKPAPAAPQSSSGPAASAAPIRSPPSGIILFAAPANSDRGSPKEAAAQRASDRKAYFEAHLAALHAGLALTADQEKLWPPLEQSARSFSAMKGDDRSENKDVDPAANASLDGTSRSAGTEANDPFKVIQAAGVLLVQRGKALQSLVAAAEPLASSLTPDQKRRLPVLIRSFSPRNMKLREFLALMTWDADADKTQQVGKTQQQGQQSDAQDLSQRADEQTDGSPMSRAVRQEHQLRQHYHESDLQDERSPRHAGRMMNDFRGSDEPDASGYDD